MTPESAILAALVTRAETLAYTLVYPSVGTNEPSGEYVEFRHIPNINNRKFLSNDAPLDRMGILQLTLCSVPGQYEITYVEKAGGIAATFGRGALPAVDGVTLHIVKSDVAQGFADGQHWRVPVSVYYRTTA